MAMAIPIVIWGRKRLTVFDFSVLRAHARGRTDRDPRNPWFAFACMVFVPVAIGRGLESRKPGEPSAGVNLR
jgi:hypothetical protein